LDGGGYKRDAESGVVGAWGKLEMETAIDNSTKIFLSVFQEPPAAGTMTLQPWSSSSSSPSSLQTLRLNLNRGEDVENPGLEPCHLQSARTAAPVREHQMNGGGGNEGKAAGIRRWRLS
jgi:hypothetical protein